MNNFFFLELINTKLFLDAKDTFSVFSALRKEAQRFNTQEEALNKVISLNQTLDTVRVVKLSIPKALIKGV